MFSAASAGSFNPFLKIVVLGLIFGTGWCSSANAYIAVNANRLTLCEVMLEFPRVALLELEKSDPAKGAFLFHVSETLLGKPVESPVKFALFQDGKLPARLEGFHPREPLIAFLGSPDNRSLIFCRGGWFITRPDQGWERLTQFRDDFSALYFGRPGDLAAAVRAVARGGSATVRVLPQGLKPTARMFVRYDAATPHRRWPARDPQPQQIASWSELQTALASESIAVRQQTLVQLANAEPPHDPEPALRNGLNDSHAEVRLAAAAGLSQRKNVSQESLQALEKALRDEDRFVCAFAARGIGNAGRQAEFAIPALTAALADRNYDHDFRPHRAAEAAEAILRIAPKSPAAERAIQLLLSERMLNDHRIDSEGTRTAAAQALGRAGTAARSTVPELLKRLKDELAATRIAAAEAIFLIGGEETAQTAAREILRREMDTGPLGDRVQALRAAANTSDPTLLKLLHNYAGDKENAIRQAVRELTARTKE